jgi:hypothetical protein
MALITTTVTPEQRITPFTGLSEVTRERSGIARAEVVVSAYGTWDAAGAGNTRSISFLHSLDTSYGYTLMECNAAFILYGYVIGMESTGVMEISTETGPGASQKESQWYQFENLPSKQDSTGTTNIGSVAADNYNTVYPITGGNGIMVFNLMSKPSGLLYPFPGVSSIDLVSMFGEAVANKPAMAYRFYCRFLQYDVTQGYNYIVNSPIMTRA